MKYASFLATSYLTFTNESCQLWSYWTEFHEIFTQPTDIIYAINANIEIAISRTVLPSGEHAKNARSINLPSFWQHYLVAMATSLDKWKYATDPSSARNALSCGEKIAKIGPVDPDILDQIGPFLAMSYQTFSNEPCLLWSYWTEFHKIFTQYTGVNAAVNAVSYTHLTLPTILRV